MVGLDALRRAPRDLRIALTATLFSGAATGIFGATLNNYLAEDHALDAGARGWLEPPRELPSFIGEARSFRWVFVLAGAIAVVGFLVCLQIRVPENRAAPVAGHAAGAAP